jgi:hypothetical protein
VDRNRPQRRKTSRIRTGWGGMWPVATLADIYYSNLISTLDGKR